MTEPPGSYPLRLGHTVRGEPVPLGLDGLGIGLEVHGDRLAVVALARTFLLQLTAHLAARSRDGTTVSLRADDRVVVGGVAVIDLAPSGGGSGAPPPPGGPLRLTIDEVPWARLDDPAGSLRLRCELTSRAAYPALLATARMRGRGPRGRHAATDENSGVFASVALIS